MTPETPTCPSGGATSSLWGAPLGALWKRRVCDKRRQSEGPFGAGTSGRRAAQVATKTEFPLARRLGLSAEILFREFPFGKTLLRKFFFAKPFRKIFKKFRPNE